MSFEDVGRLDAGGPHHQLGRNVRAVGEPDAVLQHLRHRRSRMHAHLEPVEQPGRRLRQPLGQLRQDARRGLDQVDLDVHVGIDAVEPVGDELARGLVQLGRQLRPRRAGADDGDLQLLRPQRLLLHVGADAGVDQAGVEARGLVGGLERDGVLLDAGRAEVVGQAADGDDERVVADLLGRRDLAPLRIDERRHVHDAAGPVEAGHVARAIGEAVPVGLGQVVDLVEALVHAAGGDLVQQRLPQVRALAVDQRDRGLAAPSQLVAEARGQLQPARAPADNDDPMQGCVHGPIGRARRPPGPGWRSGSG